MIHEIYRNFSGFQDRRKLEQTQKSALEYSNQAVPFLPSETTRSLWIVLTEQQIIKNSRGSQNRLNRLQENLGKRKDELTEKLLVANPGDSGAVYRFIGDLRLLNSRWYNLVTNGHNGEQLLQGWQAKSAEYSFVLSI